ncbi:hypothetical protein GCM10010123_37880 [Pilimelia anulata]|uniref:LamG-like jellyroll fold domain-containing protein n=1 Tax=Pilimelia anulata TaxID=53371 RepID=A0A8J3BCN1_9ACTN|nr:LamG domain-containing protein [Pilimelia anulata]GGK04365.1 hypothetical protein GCM10010123_37880 [Pilimelia anulata]
MDALGKPPRPALHRLLLVWVALAAVWSLPQAAAAYSTTTRNLANQLNLAATFPSYATTVDNDSPLFHHRQDDAESSSGTPAAADASGNNRTGAYAGPTEGPRTWWQFEEGTGTATTDNGGGAAVGTLTGANAAWNARGQVGGGFEVASGTGYVAGPSRVRTDAAFTVSAWAYVTGTGAHRTIVAQAGTTTSGFVLRRDSTNVWYFGMPRTDVASPTVDAVSAGAASASTWTHLVGVYDDAADLLRLYVNGASVGTVAHTTNSFNAGGDLLAGVTYWSGAAGTNQLTGRVDDVQMYPRALSATEVSDLYRAPGTVWRCDEGSGARVEDGAQYGNTGTTANTSWVSGGGPDGAGALSFNGTSSRVEGGQEGVHVDRSFSVSAWARIPDVSATYVIASQNETVTSWSGAGQSSFLLRYDLSRDSWNFALIDRTTTNSYPANNAVGSSPTPNRWYHVVGVYDDATDSMYTYVDGVASAARSYTDAMEGTPNTSQPLRAGVRQLSGVNDAWFKGQVAELRTYQRALSAADITALYRDNPLTRWEFSEGSGTSVADSANRGATGTVSNTAAWNAGGQSGSAFAANGSSYLTSGSNGLVATGTSYTVAAWLYLSDKSTSRAAISQDGTNVSGFQLGYYQPSDRLVLYTTRTDSTGGTVDAALGTTSPALNTWIHVAGIYDAAAGQLYLYVNGALASSAAHPATWSATGGFRIGRGWWTAAAAYYWQGRIDSVRAYGRALSAAEVSALYTAAAGPAGISSDARRSNLSAAQAGSLTGADQSTSTAVGYGGGAGAGGYQPIQYSNPNTFTVSAIFRADAASPGGAIAGFSAGTALVDTTADRVVFVDSGGRITFAVYSGGVAKTVRSPASYKDGAWHHVAVSLGAAGMKLYVDGTLVASDAATTTGENVSGYWRWGSANLARYANPPTDYRFTGTLDEIAVFNTQLADGRIGAEQVARS